MTVQDLTTYSLANVRFMPPIVATVGGSGSNSKKPITFHKICIRDGFSNLLQFSLPPNLESWKGVEEHAPMNKPDDPVAKATIGLRLHSRDGATDYEKAWIEAFGRLVEHCKAHVGTLSSVLGKTGLENRIDGFKSPLKITTTTDESGNVTADPFRSPYLNTDLKFRKGDATGNFEILTKFRSSTSFTMDAKKVAVYDTVCPKTLRGQRISLGGGTLSIDQIFINATVTLHALDGRPAGALHG